MAPNRDWLEWLSSLNAQGAEDVVVGGVALAHPGAPRYTGDLDVLIAATPKNADRVLRALRDFGFEGLKIGVEDLSVADRVVQIGFPPGRIDLLTSIDGAEWREVDATAETGRYGTVPVRYISRELLIRNKRASGRSQGRADAERLEAGS